MYKCIYTPSGLRNSYGSPPAPARRAGRTGGMTTLTAHHSQWCAHWGEITPSGGNEDTEYYGDARNGEALAPPITLLSFVCGERNTEPGLTCAEFIDPPAQSRPGQVLTSAAVERISRGIVVSIPLKSSPADYTVFIMNNAIAQAVPIFHRTYEKVVACWPPTNANRRAGGKS